MTGRAGPDRGHLDPLQARKSGMLSVHVDEGIVPRRLESGSGWAGSSGTALFCGPLLTALLVTDRGIAADASVLGAVPLTALASLPGFRDTLRAHNIELRFEDAADHARNEILREYLTAVGRAANDQPYPGVMPGRVPPLAAVYLRQQVRRNPAHPGHDTAGNAALAPDVLRSTDEVLALPGTCVVAGGPGSGKSSLLRAWTADLADRLLHDPPPDGTTVPVPVLVQATAVAKGLRVEQLPDALAAAAAAAARVHGLQQPTPAIAGLLRAAPMRNARWLVLIDGLDEVPDIRDRGELLKAIAAHSADHPQLYRFIITTRPAPDSELSALGREAASFSLQPFGPGDLPTVARNWLTALAVPGPEDAAGNFLTSVHRAGLDGIAGIPLITAMLCQLYARDPGRPLPGSRGDLYGQFVERLQEHFNDPGPDGLRAHTATEMARCGPAAANEAGRIRANLLDLISYLAAERWRGSSVPALDIIAAHPSAGRPAAVRGPEWHSFLDSCLRHSGLLTPLDDDLVFLHQTFLEYLTARHADRTETLTSALRDATGRTARYRPGAADMTAPRRRGRRYWVPPPQAAASYVGFLLDAAQARSLPIRQCGIVFDKPGLNRTREGADFLIALMETGTRIPDHLRQPTTDLLYALALAYTPALLHSSRLRDGPMHLITEHDDHQARLHAIRGLTELGDPRGTEILHGLALSPGLLEIFREEHARELAMLGDPRGAELLAGFAGDPDFFDGSRVSAARDLAKLGDERGADLLAALAGDRSLDGHERVEAAHELAKLGDPRGGRLLESLALASIYEIGPVVEAARKLVELGHPSAADALEYIATDKSQAGIFRTEAARELAKLGDRRTASAWLAIASTPGLHDDQSRIEAARELTKLGDPLAVNAWRVLAHDPERDSLRVAAARELAKLGDPRIADTWRALAHDPGLPPGSRRIAAEELVRLRDPRAADTCHALAHNPDLASDWRMASARGLAELGDLRAASTWRALAHDPVLDPGSRAAAAGELAKLPSVGHVTGSALTVTSQGDALMVTGSDDGMMRLWRVGTGSLELVGEPQEGHPYDCSVAVAVGQLGDRLVAVTGGSDGSVRLWRVTGDGLVQTGDPQRTAGTGSVAVGQFGDHLVAVTGGSSADVKLWRIQEGALVRVGKVRFHGGYWVGAVAVGQIGGHPVAVTGAADGSVQLWRISEDELSGTRRRPGSLPGHFLLEYLEHAPQVITPAGEPHPGNGSPVRAVALGHVDGHPVAVTGGYDGMVQLWRADDQELVPAGEPQRGHGEQRVISVDIRQIGTRPTAVTAGRDWTVRLWQVGQGGLVPRSEAEQ